MWYTVYGLYPLIRNHAALQFGFDRPWRGRRHAHSLSSYKIFYNLQYADLRLWRRLMGMKQILVMMAAVVLVGCSKDTPEPSPPAGEKLIADPIVEKAIRDRLNKPEGGLTKVDLEKVTALTLGGNKFSDAGLKDAAKLQNLEWLYMYDTQITDAGLKDVAKCTQLTSLNLGRTKITDAGLKELAKLQKLTTLDLMRTKITDAGLKDVAKLQKLTDLHLSYTQVTDAGVAELQKALPNCFILGP